MMKKVTQILCFYNEEKYIRECIKSVLTQTYSNLEIIIINDGSTDNSQSIVEQFSDERMVVINNAENHGLAWSRNQGLDIASGEYIGFIDADDISMPNRIQILAEYLNEHTDTIAVSNRLTYIDENGKALNDEYPFILDDKEIRSYFLFGNIFAGPCALFRRELVDEYAIRNDINYRASQDYHFWLQCLPYGKFHIVQDKLLRYRIHNSQTTQFVKRNSGQYDEWMTKILAYAWETRGVQMSENDIDFIYRYFYRGEKMWEIKDILYSLQLYRKTKQQCNRLRLIERKEICVIFRKKMEQCIGYLYPVCVLRDILRRER